MIRSFIAAALLMLSAAVGAQQAFSPASRTYQLAVSSVAGTAIQVSPNSASFTGCTQYLLANSGTVDMWVAFGTDSSVTPTIPSPGTPGTGTLVKAGVAMVVGSFNNAYVNAVTSSSTTTLNVSCGTGMLTGTTSIAGASGAVSDVNLKQVNGNTVNTGTGAAGSGTQRITTSTDSTIGTVTTITNPVTVTDGAGALNVIVDSGTTTVTQSTAANLNATVVGTGTFATQAAQSGTWNVTNISGTVSLPTGASTATNQTTPQTPVAPATATATKGVLGGLQYNLTAPTATDGQQGAVQGDSHLSLKVLQVDGTGTAIDPTTRVQTASTGATATSASVAQTGSSVTLLASNTNRLEAVITNTSGVTCNLGLGTTAAATTGPLLAVNAVYIEDHYKGAINSLCASGSLAVTEVSP